LKGERRRSGGGAGRKPEAARARAPERPRGREKSEPQRPSPLRKLVAAPAARRGALAGAVLLLVALSFVVRVASPWSTVFAGPAGVRLFDTDSYYHLRHARYATAHFPHLQAWDPGIYPDGQPRRYAGLFDVSIAAAALVAGGGHPSEQRVAQVAAFTPAVMGTAAVAALFWLGAVTLGQGAGLLALLLLTLYPGTFIHRSLLGAVDHHVAEALLAVLTALGLGGAVRRSFVPDAARPRWRAWVPDFLGAAPLAVFFFTWFGAPIYLVLIAAVFFLIGTLVVARGDDVTPLARAACRYGAGVLALALLVRVAAPDFVMEASYFKKALLATALFAAGAPAYLLALQTAARRSGGRASSAIALGAGLVVVVALAIVTRVVPAARSLADELLGVKTALVKEQADLTIGKVAYLGGAPAFLALLALPTAIVAAWRSREPLGPEALARLIVTCLGTLLVLLWLRTHDYGYVAPLFLALLAADVLQRAWRWARPGAARTAGAVIAAALVVVPLWPAQAASPLVPDRATIADFMVLRPGWEQALAWMRAHTPPLAEPLDAPVSGLPFRHPPGNYGVLAFWDFGHYVAELGKRPPLASGGISESAARWFLIDDEEAAVRALTHKMHPLERVRYCIVDAQTVGDFALAGVQMAGQPIGDYATIFRSADLSGKQLMRYSERFSRGMSSRLYERNGDGLAHFRLVYDSPDRSLLAYHAPRGDGMIVRKGTRFFDDEEQGLWRRSLASGKPIVLSDEVVYDGAIEPSVKIFEQVAGARLTGTASPGATVEARLELVSRDGGVRSTYRRSTTADVTGRFELVVPYPTEPDAAFTDVVAAAPYELTVSGGGEASPRSLGRVTVSSDAVETGATVSVPAPPT